MIGKAIYARLTAAQTDDTSDLTDALAALSSAVGLHIYPLISSENLYPLIVYQVHREDESTIQPLATKEFTVTLTIVATTYAQAQALSAAVRTLLDRQGGTWGGIPVRGFYFKTSEEDSYSQEDNPEQMFFQDEHEYRVWAQA